MRSRLSTVLVAASFAFFACGEIATTDLDGPDLRSSKPTESDPSQALAMMDDINALLAADGADYRVEVVEWMTDGDGAEMGNTVFFSNRGNKQLSHHFVPNDARRGWSGPGSAITWANDLFDGGTNSGLSPAQTAGAIANAMGTWDAQQCSSLPLNPLGNAPFDMGVVQFLLGFGGVPLIFADVTHAGFLPGVFFDALVPGGSGFILGVTFTFVFTATDIDNNRKADTAFREIYYNDAFSWANNGNFDVETVALHEAGHGLSQGHFGKAFLDNGTNKLHFAPRAVMNAAYSGIQQSIAATDNGGHCSIWGSWPNN